MRRVRTITLILTCTLLPTGTELVGCSRAMGTPVAEVEAAPKPDVISTSHVTAEEYAQNITGVEKVRNELKVENS